MKPKEMSGLSDEALLEQAQLIKKTKIYDAFIVGLLIGIVVFSAVKNGLNLFTFLPLVYFPIAARNRVKRNALDALLKQRNLN